VAIEKEDGARGIFRSLHERLLTLPDTCEVWPGHLGGSLCGGPGMDMKVPSTIGDERAHSELLALAEEDEFVCRSIAALGPQPPNFENIVALNRGPLAVETTEVHPLTPRQVQNACDEGALVVDIRTELQFDEAHVPDAVSITALRAGFGSKLAWLAEPGQPVVLIGRDDEDARHAATLAASVGITRLAGFLAGGMTSWREDRMPVERIERIEVAELHRRRDELQILDVRERSEWDAGHIPGSAHMPYHDIHALPEGIDPDRPVAVICSSGQRAAVAASLLRRQGMREALHVANGGVTLWRRQGWPIEEPEPTTAGS
jgi:rhodanese-related sulfurtransferase